MTQDFKNMIYLFACGARGLDPQPFCNYNIESILQKAASQNIWPTVFLAVKKLYDNKQIEVKDSVIQALQKELLQLTIKNTQRNMAVYETISYMEEHGIPCCVLKGEAVARLYHTPVCRVSCDTDLLIEREKEKAAYRKLKKFGYTAIKRAKNLHHMNCYHPVAGHVEVHVSMYSETTDDIFLNRQVNYKEDYITIQYENKYPVKTLGITDGLIFLTIHFIKHFINKGAGIRQLMDLLLYIEHYMNEIDWERFNQLMDYLKYNKLFHHLMGIGVHYFQFDAGSLPMFSYDATIAEKLLTDIEQGGIFGHAASGERNEFYSLYLKERYSTFQSGSYVQYMNQHYKKTLITKFFPVYNTMRVHYPYIEKSKVLLPIAWLHRWIKLMIKVLKGRSSVKQFIRYSQPSAESKAAKERMDLIRELDMI